jgi:hypothetical protein
LVLLESIPLVTARSFSPVPERERRSRSRSRSSDDERFSLREAERREERRRQWSKSPERKPKKADDAEVATKQYEPGSIEAQMAAMGLPVDGFSSTCGKHVEGNDDFVVADVKNQRKARQYMNKRSTKADLDRVKAPIRR